MKRNFIKMFFLLISIVGFANRIPYGFKLVLSKINGKPVEEKNIHITIDNEKQNIFGSSGCNNFSLNYTSKVGTNCIKTKLPAGTLMACEQTIMKSEADFTNTIKERKFKIKIKKNKVLFKNWIGKTIMEYDIQTNENHHTFIGKNNWKLISLDKEVKNYDYLSLKFNIKEGLFLGKTTQCNSFSTTMKIEGEYMHFGKIISTMMTCPDQEIGKTEQKITDILSGKKLRFDLSDQTLNLYDKNRLVMIFGITDQEY